MIAIVIKSSTKKITAGYVAFLIFIFKRIEFGLYRTKTYAMLQYLKLFSTTNCSVGTYNIIIKVGLYTLVPDTFKSLNQSPATCGLRNFFLWPFKYTS